MANIEDVQSQLKDLGASLSEIAREASAALGDRFITTAKSAGDIERHLKATLDHSKDLQKSYKSVSALEAGMLKNKKVFQKVQESIMKNFEQEKEQYWDKVKVRIEEQVSGIEDIEEQERKRQKLGLQYQKVMDDAEASLERQLDLLKGQTGLWAVVKGTAAKAVALLGKGVDAAVKMAEGIRDASSVQGASESVAKPFDDLLASIPAVGGVLKFGFQTLRKSFFAVWDYVEKRVLPTNKKLIEQFGALTPETNRLKKQAISTGNSFVKMGLSFEQGSASVVNFGAALKTTNFGNTDKEMSDLMATGLRLTEVVGMSADQAGDLAIAFDRAGLSTIDLKGAMIEADDQATSLGVPVNQVRKDMGEFPSVFQRFGASSSLEFSKAASIARAYGTSIDKVNASFGQQMDSFDKTSEAGANLNAIFGTHINSYDLMLETDPTKRMVMLGEEMLKQGKTWDKLSVFEKNVVKETLGVDDAMGALVLSQKNVGIGSDALSRKLKNQQDKQDSLQKGAKRWEESIGGLKLTLLNFEEAIGRIVRAIANLLSKFLGLPGAGKGVKDTAKMLGDMFDTLEAKINGVDVKGIKEDFEKFTNSTGFKMIAKLFGFGDEEPAPLVGSDTGNKLLSVLGGPMGMVLSSLNSHLGNKRSALEPNHKPGKGVSTNSKSLTEVSGDERRKMLAGIPAAQIQPNIVVVMDGEVMGRLTSKNQTRNALQ